MMLFKMDCKYSAEVLSSVPKHKKARMRLQRKYVLDKLCSSMNYCVVGHGFNINESAIQIKKGVFEQKNTQNQVMY